MRFGSKSNGVKGLPTLRSSLISYSTSNGVYKKLSNLSDIINEKDF